MTWDLATAKARLGIESDDQDQAITAAMAVAIAVAEGYCDRRFLKQEDTQEFTLPCGPTLLVRRYPLVSLATIEPLDPQQADPIEPVPVPASWRMNKTRGMVFIVGAPPWVNLTSFAQVAASAYDAGARSGFVLTYTGGYDPLPADLEQALWQVFDAVWFSTPGWGADPGSQSGAGADAVKSFAIDGMTLAFDTGSGDKAASSAGGDVSAWGPLLPLSATTLLQPYRAETVIGVG